eukprot:859120-Pyramimonas_sp.AAC.1
MLRLDTDTAELTLSRPYQAVSLLENSVLPPIVDGCHMSGYESSPGVDCRPANGCLSTGNIRWNIRNAVR